jgi:hypothetical protein
MSEPLLSARARCQRGTADKEWRVVATEDRVTIQYGRTGASLRTLEIPRARCPQGTFAEARKRLQEKLDKGYVLLDEQRSPEADRREREQARRELEATRVAIEEQDWGSPSWF